MTDNNSIISGILGDQFKLYMTVPQKSKESPKVSEGLPVSLPVTIQEILDNMKDRVSRDSTVELNNKVIHKRQIPGQH